MSDWKVFFFSALIHLPEQLMEKLETHGIETKLARGEKSLLTFIDNNPDCKSGEIAKRLGILSPTVKRILPYLVEKKSN